MVRCAAFTQTCRFRLWLLLGAAGAGGMPAGAGLEQHAGLEMKYHLTQDNRYSTRPWLPGYRLGFVYDSQFHLSNPFSLFFEAASLTLISRGDTSTFLMDRVQYRLAPGARLHVAGHEVSALLAHECVHWLDRGRRGGSIFWNELQVNVGSQGAYDHNLAARAATRSAPARHALDYRLGTGTFLQGSSSKYIAQNQDYRRHAHTVLRYNLALRNRPVAYLDWRQDFWMTADNPRPPQGRRQYKGGTQLGWVLPTRRGVGVLFTEYTYLDQSPFLNEHSLWSVGVRLQH